MDKSATLCDHEQKDEPFTVESVDDVCLPVYAKSVANVSDWDRN